MIESSVFKRILDANSDIEAVIQLSQDGFILQFESRYKDSVEEIVSIAAGLFATAKETESLIRNRKVQMFISTEHGMLYMRELADKSVLLSVIKNHTAYQQIEKSFIFDQYI